MLKHSLIIFHVIENGNSIVQHNSNHKWNIDKCKSEFKKCDKCKKDYSWNSSPCVCENSKYLKKKLMIQ